VLTAVEVLLQLILRRCIHLLIDERPQLGEDLAAVHTRFTHRRAS
jgi:hypothetical protein